MFAEIEETPNNPVFGYWVGDIVEHITSAKRFDGVVVASELHDCIAIKWFPNGQENSSIELNYTRNEIFNFRKKKVAK